MAEVLIWIFLGFCSASIISFYLLMRSRGFGAGNYYGNPDASRSQLYADFLSEIERCVMYVRDREGRPWPSSDYRLDDIWESKGRIDEMLHDITLIAPENLVDTATHLNRYVTMNYTKPLSFESAEFLGLKSKFKDEAAKD